MSDYPRAWSFQRDGKVCVLRYRSLAKAAIPDLNEPGQKVEKFVVSGEIESGEAVTVWLGADGKLVNMFREELGRRAKNGATDFEQGERITISQSQERRPSRTSGYLMWDWDVAFELAAPPPSAAALMLEGYPATDDNGALDELAGRPGTTDDDDLPF